MLIAHTLRLWIWEILGKLLLQTKLFCCELCTEMWQCWRMWKFPSMSKYSQLSRDWELSRKSFGLLVNSSRRSYLQRELSFVLSFLMNALMLCATNAISSPTELGVLRCPSNAAKKKRLMLCKRARARVKDGNEKWKVWKIAKEKKRNLCNNFVSANTTEGFRHFSWRKKSHWVEFMSWILPAAVCRDSVAMCWNLFPDNMKTHHLRWIFTIPSSICCWM